MSYKDVPITAAKKIAEEFDKDQVIVVCWDKEHGRTHVTTYGKTTEDCAQAAQGGNFVKKALGWPDEECKATPERLRKEQQ
jgi:hypothetical protein